MPNEAAAEPGEAKVTNHRNGTSGKTVITGEYEGEKAGLGRWRLSPRPLDPHKLVQTLDTLFAGQPTV